MDTQDRYNELEEITSSLDYLIDKITDNYYKDALYEIKYEAQKELDNVSEILEAEQEQEYREQEREYWEGAI